jgi:autotransporter-associated beta strand protein
VTFKSAGSGAPTIRTDEQALTLGGALDWQTGVAVAYKWGTNELVLAGTGGSVSGTPKLYVRQGGLTFASGADYTLTGSTRESIKLGLSASIKTSLTIENNASVNLGGILVSAEATATAGNDALLTQNGGTVTLSNTSENGGDALALRDWGTAPATYVMNGGTLTMPQASWANIGNYGPGRITVNGGSMTLGRFAAGVQMTVTNAASGGSTEVTVNGGRLAAAGSWSWTSDSGARPTDVVLNGGTLALPATRTYGTNANRWASLTLSGGTLEMTGAALDTSATDDYLAGLRRVALGAAGSVVDTKALNVTVRQNVLGLTSTGGVAKVGSGSLTLDGTNTLWGLVDVREGTLRARLTHLDLPAAPLFRYGMDSVTNPDLSGNGLALTVANPSNLAVTNRTPAATALAFNGIGYYSAPHNPHFTNVTDFTLAAWLLLTNNVVGSNCSILSTRPGGDRAFELKLNAGDNVLRVLQHSYDSQTWWQEFRTVNAIQLGQWTHVAVSLTPQGIAMYLNGVRQAPIRQVYTSGGTGRDYPGGYYFPGDFRFVPAGRTGGLMIGRPSINAGPGFNGAMDDLMLFERALSDAEVAALASEALVRPASLRVTWQGTFDMLGVAPTVVSEASGSGQIVNGTLEVKDLLSVGDAADETPGALLTVANLTLGTNVTYACSCDGAASDLTRVTGALQVNGAGVVDFGRTEENPLAGSLSASVMTYSTVTGASNFANWSVTGLGRRGYETSVRAENGQVIVTLRSLYGSLMLLK